jgi:hypothetical protein
MANPLVSGFDPKQVIITFGGVPITGFADGTYVEVTPNDADGFKKVVGADGEVMRSQSNDNTHTVTITLLQSSQSNQHLSGIRNTDKLTGKAVQALSIRDLNGGTLMFWAQAWIKGDPTWGYGKENTDRQWTFDTGQIGTDNRGGAAVL